jgi:uncharacterized Zn finger protein (UPF0148 family)
MSKKKRDIIDGTYCKDCGSRTVYALKDGTIVCRRCSHRESSEIKNKENINGN